MNFWENELPRKDRTSSFLPYEADKRVLKFQANVSEVFEALSSNDGSNFIQILVSNLNLESAKFLELGLCDFVELTLFSARH